MASVKRYMVMLVDLFLLVYGYFMVDINNSPAKEENAQGFISILARGNGFSLSRSSVKQVE